MQKRARKRRAVTTMDNAMTRDESGGSVSKSAKGGDSSEGVETPGVDRSATASAHIDEMRVSAAAKEVRLSNRVEHDVSELLERAHKVPAFRPDMSPEENDALHESRMSSLIELLSAVNETEHSIEKVKKSLLDAMRVEQVRMDRHFRYAILSIFKLCMQPLGALSTLRSNVAMTGAIPNTVCLEAEEDDRVDINRQKTTNAAASVAANVRTR